MFIKIAVASVYYQQHIVSLNYWHTVYKIVLKIPIDCGEFHVMHDLKIYDLQADVNASNIATRIASEWLNSLTYHDNIKCISANGQTIIKTVVDKMSCSDFSFQAKRYLETLLFLIIYI